MLYHHTSILYTIAKIHSSCMGIQSYRFAQVSLYPQCPCLWNSGVQLRQRLHFLATNATGPTVFTNSSCHLLSTISRNDFSQIVFSSPYFLIYFWNWKAMLTNVELFIKRSVQNFRNSVYYFYWVICLKKKQICDMDLLCFNFNSIGVSLVFTVGC